MSLSIKEAQEKAKQYDSSLRADDPRFRRYVNILSDNCGTSLHYDNAFALIDDCWVYVFTEHYGYHIFHKEEVRVGQYQYVDIEDFRG